MQNIIVLSKIIILKNRGKRDQFMKILKKLINI